jgi:hypothetical protein
MGGFMSTEGSQPVQAGTGKQGIGCDIDDAVLAATN